MATEIGSPPYRIDLFVRMRTDVADVRRVAPAESEPERIPQPVRPDLGAIRGAITVPEWVRRDAFALAREVEHLAGKRVDVRALSDVVMSVLPPSPSPVVTNIVPSLANSMSPPL